MVELLPMTGMNYLLRGASMYLSEVRIALEAFFERSEGIELPNDFLSNDYIARIATCPRSVGVG